MKLCRFWSGKKNQNGFALLDFLVALAISGVIGAGASMATIQVINQGTRNKDYTAASQQAQNAIHWLSRDTQMAQAVTGADGFPVSDNITLSWTEWDHTSHEVVYSLNGDELRRNYTVDGGEPIVLLIARNINSISENTSFTVETTAENVTMVMLRVTATVGTGTKAVNVTKEREIIPRSGM